MSKIELIHNHDAKNLAEINKSEPIWEKSTPKWLLRILEKKGIENSTFRINKVNFINKITVNGYEYDSINSDNINFQQQPSEIELASIETLIQIPSKVYDILNYPHNQMNNQIRLTIENIKEQQENYFINNPNDGLITQCEKINRKKIYETDINPDILDDLLVLVWNKPTFYMMHPIALSNFCKSCTSKGLLTENMELFGYKFISWRGLPIIVSDKIPYDKTSLVFLIRTGIDDSGVIQLFNSTNKSQYPGFFIETSMTDTLGSVNTRVTLYTNIAILSTESIACASFTCLK